MDTSAPQCLLKILSGLHQGAEVLLSTGSYVVGSSEDCDIIISDVSIEPQQFKLVYQPPSLSLEALAPGVFVNGRRVGEGSVGVPFLEFITVGTTQIVVGPAGGGWPPITAADAPPLEEEKLNTEEASAPPQQTPEESTLVDAMAVVSGLPPSPIDERLAQPLPKPSVVKSDLQRFIWPACAVLLSLLVVAVAYYTTVVWIPSTSTKAIMPTPAEREAAVRHTVTLQGATKELKITLQQGQVVVTGFVHTEAQRLALRRSILSADPYALIHIQSEEMLVNSAQTILSELSFAVTAEPSGQPGVLIVSGYVPTADAWARGKSHLMQDVDGLKQLEDHVLTAEAVARIAAPLLNKEGISMGAIHFFAQPTTIRIDGSLTTPQAIAWETSVLPSLKKSVQDRVLLTDAVIRSNAALLGEQYFDGEIESLNIGSFGWISLKNGEKYFVGGLLPSGYVVVSLDSNGITLRKGSEFVVFKPQNI